MASYTLYRCDYCGQTRENKTGFVVAQIGPERLPFGSAYMDTHPAMGVEVCSMDCFVGWANSKARNEFAQLETQLAAKPKKAK